MKMLIADDDADTRLLVSTVLETAGHECTPACDAMQVMFRAVHGKPDLIVLDLSMPAGTGIGALEKLRASTITAGIPVIVLSGVRDPGIIGRVLELGAMEFLPKPVDPDALLAAVLRVGRAASPA